MKEVQVEIRKMVTRLSHVENKRRSPKPKRKQTAEI